MFETGKWNFFPFSGILVKNNISKKYITVTKLYMNHILGFSDCEKHKFK